MENVEKYNVHGTSLNHNKDNSDRPQSATTAENVEKVHTRKCTQKWSWIICYILQSDNQVRFTFGAL